MVRPCRSRASRAAFSSTSICLLTAGSDMAKGAAISPTLSSLPCASIARMARRVSSERAEKTVFSDGSIHLANRLNVAARQAGIGVRLATEPKLRPAPVRLTPAALLAGLPREV